MKFSQIFIVLIIFLQPLAQVSAQDISDQPSEIAEISIPAVDDTTSTAIPESPAPETEVVEPSVPSEAVVTESEQSSEEQNPETLAEEENADAPETSVIETESSIPPVKADPPLPPSTIKQPLPEADVATGALVYSYPLRTPPGRNGIQPNLALNYNSQNTEESSLFGFGWTLNIPTIERKNLYGINKLYENLDFSASGDGDLKLINELSNTANFGAKFESEFKQYSLVNRESGGYWVVKDKLGVTYTYGLDSTARLDNPADPTKVFRWYLTEIKDTSGNFVSYQYTKIDEQVYLDTISYTHNGSAVGPFLIKFILEDRPDQPMSSKTGFVVHTTKRIRFIESYVAGTLVGKYDLGYIQLPINNRSQISQISFTGSADDGVQTAELPTRFEYDSISNTNLLTKIIGVHGGTTTVDYKSSLLYRDNNGELLNPNLPFAMMTAERISYDDGNGLTWANTFQYAGGWYFFNGPFDRRFVGFGKVVKTNSVGTQTASYYHQGNGDDGTSGEVGDSPAKAGKIYKTELLSQTGALFQRSFSQWSKADLGNGRQFAKLMSVLSQSFEGNSSHRDRAQSFSYDDLTGNLLTDTSWGEVIGQDSGNFTDIGNDKLQTDISYASNAVLNIVGLQSRNITLDKAGTIVSESKMYYDEQAFGAVQKGLLTKNENWISGSTYATTQKTYDAVNGNVLSEIDPRGKVTSYQYDAFNLYPITVTNPLGHTVRYVYDYTLGKPKQITDQNNFVYQTLYDGLDRMIEEKQPDPDQPTILLTKTLYEYSPQTIGTRLKTTQFLDANTTMDSFQYTDGFDRSIQTRTEMEDANTFAVTDTIYNNIEQIYKQSLPYSSSGSSKTSPQTNSNLLITMNYDALSRVVSTQNSLGTETNSYDDWKVTTTNALGKSKTAYTDAYDRLIKIEEVNNDNLYPTIYEYNGAGNLVKLIDALGNIRNFSYDGLSRQLSAEDLHAPADTTFGLWQYSYDLANNLTQTINPNGQIVQYTFDGINRIKTEDFLGQSGLEVTYTYDVCTNGKGKLCTAVSVGATTAYQYNALGQTVEEQKTIDSINYKTTYSYDRIGNLVNLTNPDNSQIKYGYNTAGQLETIQRKESTDASFTDVVIDFDYSPHGLVSLQENHNGTKTINTYDPQQMYRQTQKLTTTTQVPTTKLQDISYSYDANGNILQIQDNSDTNSKKTINYTYDNLDRLVTESVQGASSGNPSYTNSFEYDAIGNMIFKSDVGTIVYEEDLNSFTNPHAPKSIGSIDYEYDKNGNVIKMTDLSLGPVAVNVGSTWENTWDYNSRLVETKVDKNSTRYSYDHVGERIKLETRTVNNIYPTAEYSLENGVPLKHITAGPQFLATVMGSGVDAQIYTAHTDHLTGTSIMSSGVGAIAQLIDYYAYGKIRLDQRLGNFNEQRKFAGHNLDSSTGFTYMQARYYNGSTGRFLSQDPMFWKLPKELLIDPQQQNSYSYARNNPINRSDPSGLLTIAIHGTNTGGPAWEGSQKTKDYLQRISKTFNENAVAFSWSGNDNKRARAIGAQSLNKFISQHSFQPGEQLNIVAHSHGGNVVFEAQKNMARKIDNLVTIATPVRGDYKADYSKIGRHIHTFSIYDGVQILGGQATSLSQNLGLLLRNGFGCGWCKVVGDTLKFGEYGPAGNIFRGATNVDVTRYVLKNPFFAHTMQWSSEGVWARIDQEFK